MPGIVTHSRIFKETILYLPKKDKKTYLVRSLETLFNTPDNFRAGLCGAIGPNIFDYIPVSKMRNQYGNDISFAIHNGGSAKILSSMIDTICSYRDKNNEFAAVQRAYLYGFLSHLVVDSVFHPFIFYYSGFPKTNDKKEVFFFREQNLLFNYHLDNFFQYFDENARNYRFSIEEMLPTSGKRFPHTLVSPIQVLIADSLREAYPDLYAKILLFDRRLPGAAKDLVITYLDILPYLIRMAYRLKRGNNRRLNNLFAGILRNRLFYSDFLVRYPMNKKFNKAILNNHRERWEYPDGRPGLHYESVQNLLAIACDKTVVLWEKIESNLYGKANPSIIADISINAYTNDPKLTYHDMKLKRPIRLSA